MSAPASGPAPEPAADGLLDALLAAVEAREAVALVTVIGAEGTGAPALGRRMLVWQEPERAPLGTLWPGADSAAAKAARSALEHVRHETRRLPLPGGLLTYFIEVQAPPAHLIICGAGHIAVPLATMAALCDFTVTVIDDRPLYANAERFPTADQVIAGPFRTELAALRQGRATFPPRTCLVLVTRGHQHDVDCLLEVLDDPLAYVGMIGSRRRIRAVFDLLEREQGIAPQRLEPIHAPIGLDIAARTPAEIAVAILAEIINTLRGGQATGLSESLRQERQARIETARRAHAPSAEGPA